MKQLHAGFSRVNVTPMLGIWVEGYFIPRYADGVLDELEINALALSCGDDKAVFLSIDNAGVKRDAVAEFKESIMAATGLPVESIYIHGTHTHTAPVIAKDSVEVLEQEYYQTVKRKMTDAAVMAQPKLCKYITPMVVRCYWYGLKEYTTKGRVRK